jgi:hypothetical protein
MNAKNEVLVLNVTVDSVDFEALESGALGVGTYGRATVSLAGVEHSISFLVVTGNLYTGESLDEDTAVRLFLTDESGDGDLPDLPEEIEAALLARDEVKAAVREVSSARDHLLAMEEEE